MSVPGGYTKLSKRPSDAFDQKSTGPGVSLIQRDTATGRAKLARVLREEAERRREDVRRRRLAAQMLRGTEWEWRD